MFSLSIDRQLDEPVYEQVAQQVRRMVVSGDLEVGTNLPSVRQLARDLGVSLNTIARAYRSLEADGFVQIRDRAGVTVLAPSQRNAPQQELLLQELREQMERLWQAGMSAERMQQVLEREVARLASPSKEKSNG